MTARWSEQPRPGIQPGMADHAPTGWVVAGEGPGAEHRFFATFGAWAVLEAEGVMYDAVILRFGGVSVLEAEGVIHDALILRFARGDGSTEPGHRSDSR